MTIKRLLGEGSGEGSEAGENKLRRLSFNFFGGATGGRAVKEHVSKLEPLIRRWVREEVDSSFRRLSYCCNQIEPASVSRTYQLRFLCNIPATIFTGSRILSDEKSPVEVVLYDVTSQKIITSGSVASSKVAIVVLDGEFNPEDHDDSMGQQFDRKTVQNREGKRPLVTGDLIVQLHEGVGYVGDVCFTDNSSWIRSGKFRLGAKIHAKSDQSMVREGVSNAFRVKDHRGESYQKHYPPSLNDEVWRLEKIAKDGPSHKKLMDCEIHSVQDFLRLYFRNPSYLRSLLPSISNKMWETIIGHALTCKIDEKLFLYTSAHGTSLVFNCVHKIVGATFDGQNYHSLDKLDIYQAGVVEHLKQHAYGNTNDWISVGDPSVIGCTIPMLSASSGGNLFDNPSSDNTNEEGEHDYLEMQMNPTYPTISFSEPYKDKELCTSSFEMSIASSSHQAQGFNLALGNSLGVNNSPDDFLIGNHMWDSVDNYVGSQPSHDDLPVNGNFLVESSGWHGSRLFLGSQNHNIGAISSDSGIHTPKTRWCKVLAVIKWRILVRRNVAARKLKRFYG